MLIKLSKIDKENMESSITYKESSVRLMALSSESWRPEGTYMTYSKCWVAGERKRLPTKNFVFNNNNNKNLKLIEKLRNTLISKNRELTGSRDLPSKKS